MKRYLAIGLLLVGAESVAIECGPSMRAALIQKLGDSVLDVNGKLSQHSTSLLAERKRLINLATPGMDLTAIDKVSAEYDDVDFAHTVGSQVEAMLSNGFTLALIRDRMFDVRDKAIVSAFLSLQLATAGKVANQGSKTTNSILTRISRPGVAVDVAKLRDTIDVVVETLEMCTPPPQAVGK